MKKYLILPLLLTVLCTGCSKDKVAELRPNIIFILADDQRNDIIGCAGHPVVKTPTIDKLASRGVRFTNTFVTTPICAASRASIFTGLHESKHNYTFGKGPIKAEYIESSYPYILKKSGYNTGFVGKFGVHIEHKDSLLNMMFNHYKLSPKNAPYFKQLPNGGRRHSAEVKGDQAIEYINMQDSKQPFCLSISFNAVHAVDSNLTPGNEGHYPYPAAVADLYEDVEMPLPRLTDPEIINNHPDFLMNSLNRERYFWRWDTEEKYQVNMRAYFRMISGYDNVIERVLDALKAKGLDKNTIIIYSADNGYYMGNRGFAGKWSHYEESLRVPLIIYDPRAPKSTTDRVSDKIALNIDISATILDYAGAEQPPLYQGRSLMPLMNTEESVEWRDGFFCEHRMDNAKLPKHIGYRGERFTYTRYYEQSPEYEYLHDLKNDPDQLVNLADDPKYNDILLQMRDLCNSSEERLKR